MNWISVKDELPEKGVWVLVYLDESVTSGKYLGGRWSEWELTWLGIHGCGCCGDDSEDIVTHWMPLPKLPKN